MSNVINLHDYLRDYCARYGKQPRAALCIDCDRRIATHGDRCHICVQYAPAATLRARELYRKSYALGEVYDRPRRRVVEVNAPGEAMARMRDGECACGCGGRGGECGEAGA